LEAVTWFQVTAFSVWSGADFGRFACKSGKICVAVRRTLRARSCSPVDGRKS